MAIDDTGSRTPSFIERAKALFTRPQEVWPEIDRDMTPSGELFTRYAAPLAALAPIVGFITGRVFNWSPFGFSFFGQLFTAVGGYAFSMVNLLVMSFIASKLAPKFGGEGSPRDAFKLIVYSSTAMWIASAAAMIPGLQVLGFAGFFSLYLYFTGIGPIMKVPETEKRRFGVATIICAIALNVVTMSIANAPARILDGPSRALNHRPTADIFNFDSTVFQRDFRRWVHHDNVKPVAPNALEALLPAKIGNFERKGLENALDGPAGSHAKATYENGDRSFTLRVVDLAGFGAAFGNFVRIEQNKQDEHGFKHVTNKDGTFVAEKWDNDDREGDYTTVASKRFLIEAKGETDNFDELKQAVGSIDQGKLTALTK
jgi:hypothetical protein